MQLFFFKNNDWNGKKLRNTSTSSINLQRQQHWEWQRMSMERESVKETWSKCNGERYFIIYRHIARDLMHWLLVYLSVNWKYLRIWHFMGRWKPLLTLFHWRSLPLNSVMSLHTQTATHKFARLRNDNVSAIKSFASKIERGSRKKTGSDKYCLPLDCIAHWIHIHGEYAFLQRVFFSTGLYGPLTHWHRIWFMDFVFFLTRRNFNIQLYKKWQRCAMQNDFKRSKQLLFTFQRTIAMVGNKTRCREKKKDRAFVCV